MASFHPNDATGAVNNISAFSTNMVFESCQDLIDWAQKLGRSLGYIIIIKQRKIRASGLLTKVLLMCDRGGIYKSTKISSRDTGTDRFLNFGNHTTNRVESQHAKLKYYLDTTQADLWTCASFIHNLVDSQLTTIKSSFQTSKSRKKHRHDMPHFENLWGFVSRHALGILLDELELCEGGGFSCDCQMRTGYGLPCAHEQRNYMNAGQPLPLESIHMFWRKLDFSKCVVDDDLRCDEEVPIATQNFMTSTTLLRDPVVHMNNRGRPSSKHKTSKNNRGKKPTEEPHMDSSYPGQRNDIESYINQFPYILHRYICHVQDVIGDGNCGFRAIASCLGFQENDWPKIRADLLQELDMHPEYNDMFGGQYRFQVFNSLNFFRSDISAPTENWLLLPETGILIASRYNVILHSLSNAVSTTYFPLWSSPPPIHEQIVIAIGHVNNNHWVRVDLREEYPMPPVFLQWNYYRRPCAAGWITPYIDRLNLYAEFLYTNRPFYNFEDVIPV